MNQFFEKEFTSDRVWRIFFSIAFIASLFGAFYIIRSAIYPFLIGWFIAAVSMPIVRFYQFRLKIRNRLISMALGLISVLAIFGVIILLVVPPTIAEVHKATDMVLRFEEQIRTNEQLPAFIDKYLSYFINPDEIVKYLDSQHIIDLTKKYIPQLIDVASKAAIKLFNLIDVLFVLLYAFFIMLYYEVMIDDFFGLIPAKWRNRTRQVFRDLADNTKRYFRGQSMVALIVGILFSIGFLIIGLPLAIPLGLLIGLLNMVPYAQIIGILPTLLLCALHSMDTSYSFWRLTAFCFLLFVIVQTLQDTIITPKIMGKVTGFNPAIILLCLSIGGVLFGITGVAMALPISTMLLSYYHIYILRDTKEIVEDLASEKQEENNKKR